MVDRCQKRTVPLSGFLAPSPSPGFCHCKGCPFGKVGKKDATCPLRREGRRQPATSPASPDRRRRSNPDPKARAVAECGVSRLSLATFTIAPPSPAVARRPAQIFCSSQPHRLHRCIDLGLEAPSLGRTFLPRPGLGMVTRIGLQLFLHLTCSPRNMTVVAVLIRGSWGLHWRRR